VLVTFPLMGRGRVLLLDWTIGPHEAIVSPAALGLAGGSVAGLPISLLVGVLAHAVGAAITWLPILIFFPVATFAAGRLTGGRPIARLSAGLLYSVNPFVLDRLFAGHIGFLIGYALLPLAVASLLEAPTQRIGRSLAPVLWVAVLIGCSVHFAWIAAVVAIVVAVTVVFEYRRPLRTLAWGVTTALGVAATSTYLLVAPAATKAPVRVGAADLSAFRTSGDPRVGLYANVAGLYGFWRTGEVRLPKASLSGWPFLLVALLLIVVLGAWEMTRRADRRSVGIVLIASGAVGYLLALGDQGPTGALFRWAYFHLPGFEVMREPQKFLCLLALAYAVLFGNGVDFLTHRKSVRTIAPSIAILLALPLGYCFTLFGGLNGQLRPAHIPNSWAAADATMGTGAGEILFLPWHLYMSFPFTNGRVIANPAPEFFRRRVISGDNVELPTVASESTSGRSAFLQYLFAHGSDVRSFGAILAPLDVRYVVLAKSDDWRSYGWLHQQTDLSLVLDTPTLEVWANGEPTESGSRTAVTDHGRSWASLLARPPVAAAAAGVTRRSPILFQVDPGPPGWIQLAEPYDPGWTLAGKPPVPLPEGNMAWPVGRSAAKVKFGPWRRVRLGYLVSLAAVAVIAAVWYGASKGHVARRDGG